MNDLLRQEIEGLMFIDPTQAPSLSVNERLDALEALIDRERRKAVEEALNQDFYFLHGVPVNLPTSEKQRVSSAMFPSPTP